jgi:Ca2+:H+ antiporter
LQIVEALKYRLSCEFQNDTAGVWGVIRSEFPLWVGIFVVVVFKLGGEALLGGNGHALVAGISFVSIFAVMLWLSFRVVHHAECLALKLGEPYGTLILTLSVICIEVVMICALMVQGGENPTLARDTMFSVLMIVLNGMLGITLLLGGLRHHQQVINLEGARSYLIVILCLAFLTLVLPTFSRSGGVGSASPMVFTFLAIASVGLYGIFLFLQSTSHRDFFQNPVEEGGSHEDDAHDGLEARSTAYHAAFLLLTLIPIVLLSKKLPSCWSSGFRSSKRLRRWLVSWWPCWFSRRRGLPPAKRP